MGQKVKPIGLRLGITVKEQQLLLWTDLATGSDEHKDLSSLVLPGYRAVLAGDEVELTKRELELLSTLARNAGVVLSRERLLELVWGYDFVADTNVVDVFVGYLRRKLEIDGHPRLLHTIRGVGFVLREPR